jgi:WD40 repeat protein
MRLIAAVHNTIYDKRVSNHAIILAMRRRLGLILLLAGSLYACSPSSVAHKRDFAWLRRDTLAWSSNSRWLAVAVSDGIYLHDDQQRYRGVEPRKAIEPLFATEEKSGTVVLFTVTRSAEVSEERLDLPRGGRSLESPRFPVRLAYSPDGKWLAGGVRGDELDNIYLWDLGSGQIAQELEPRVRAVSSIDFSSTGQFLAIGRWHETDVLVWDVTTGELACTLAGHTSAAHTVVFSPDGEDRLATGSDDHTVRLWDTATCQLLHVLEGHSNWISDVTFSPNGQVLTSSGMDGLIFVWDPERGTELYQLKGQMQQVYDIEFSPDGDLLAAGGSDNAILLWEVNSGRLAGQLNGDVGTYEMAWSPNGQVLAVAAMKGKPAGNVLLWDFTEDAWVIRRPGFSPPASTLEQSVTSPLPESVCASPGSGIEEGFRSSFAGRMLFARTGGEEAGLYLVTLLDVPETRRLLGVPDIGLHAISWQDADLSPDGQQIVLASQVEEGLTELYMVDVEDRSWRRLTNNLLEERDPVWSPGGARIAFSARSRSTNGDDVVEEGDKWEIYTVDVDGTSLRQVTHNGGVSTSPSWSPDGQWLSYRLFRGQDWLNALYLVNLETGENHELTPGLNPWSWYEERFPWSPDGSHLAMAGQSESARSLYLVGVETASETRILDTAHYTSISEVERAGAGRVSRPVWSPDGAAIAFEWVCNRWSRDRHAIYIFQDDDLNLLVEWSDVPLIPLSWRP